MNLQTAKSVRVQDSLLAPLERPVLAWLVRRLPASTTPDHLTLLGFAAMLLAGVSYALTGFDVLFFHLVNFFLLLNWFGDSLDGTLARHTGKLRPRYGFYVDHMIDAFGTLFLVGGMAVSGVMGERAAMTLLTAYLLMSIHSYLCSQTLGVFRISFFGFSPTELRILLAVGNLVAIGKPVVRIAGEPYRLFDAGALVASAVMGCVLLASSIATARRLYRLERV